MTMKTIKRGDRGEEVRKLQAALSLIADGIFGVVTEEAVKCFQREAGLTPDGIVGAKTWAALGISEPKELNLKTSRKITEIIVHCTATREGTPVSVEQIRQWHRQRGFADIGYHYVIDLNGGIHKGRDIDKVGAHCLNHNANSIGVVYVGGLDAHGKAKDTRTEAQKIALVNLLKALKVNYPKATIHGHRDYARKDCPCFDATKEYAKL